MALQFLFLVVGFVLLIKGADWLVDGASSTALNFKVSKMLIGLTIVAFGTGAPELAVSISSLLSGKTDMLLGNVVGSNVLNILLLLGIGALIRPIKVKKDTVRKELPMLILISIAIVVLFLSRTLSGSIDAVNVITRSDGMICLLLFGIFIYYLIAMARRNRNSKTEVEKPRWKVGKSILITLIGLIGVVVGSQFVVNSASTIASVLGVSDRVIALTIVAFGTSLPELVTTITAAKRGETDLLVGNIVGSNIFNICIVLGLPVAIYGTIIPSVEGIGLYIDLGMMLFAAIFLWLCTVLRDRKIGRMEGMLMLLSFAIYYSYVIYGALA